MSDLVASDRLAPAQPGSPEAVAATGADSYLSLLREDVEAAGKTTRLLRLGANVATVTTLIALAPEGYTSLLHDLRNVLASGRYEDTFLRVVMAAAAAAILGGQGLASVAAAAYRRFRAKRLGRRLGMFTPGQQLAALQPLESAVLQDTRAIVAPLLRLARAASGEVTPATAESLEPPPARRAIR